MPEAGELKGLLGKFDYFGDKILCLVKKSETLVPQRILSSWHNIY